MKKCFFILSLLFLTFVACQKTADQLIVVDTSGTPTVHAFLPNSGGTVTWLLHGVPGFTIEPTTKWPCEIKYDSKSGQAVSATCTFRSVEEGHYAIWHYRVKPPSTAGALGTGGGTQGPPEGVTVGHCTSCPTPAVVKPKYAPSPTATTHYLSIECGTNGPTVDQPNVPVNAGDVIDWQVNGDDPAAVIKLTDSGTCSNNLGDKPSPEIQCSVAKAGTYTITKWAGCTTGPASPTYQISVTGAQ